MYYFPKTVDYKPEHFVCPLKCAISMIECADVINAKMKEHGLPSVKYRVSMDFGTVIPVIITMTSKDKEIDEDGNFWTYNSPWTKQSIPVDNTLAYENSETVGNHGFDRSHNMFDSYKNAMSKLHKKN